MIPDTPSEPPQTAPDDATLRAVLTGTRVVAMVGLSSNPLRASYFVARYLSLRGIRVIPVNPGLAGQQVLGQSAVARLADIPASAGVDMVDVFRRPAEVPDIMTEALAHLPGLRCFWMQIGVSHPQAAAMGRAHGLTVIEDRCPKLEWQRLFGELRMGGFNTGIVSSRL